MTAASEDMEKGDKQRHENLKCPKWDITQSVNESFSVCIQENCERHRDGICVWMFMGTKCR